MAEITIQVLEGLERGRVFDSLETPVTIGREDDNTIQLNDERISRFHSKIQEDGERIILTDLDSTNGTRVNGRPVQLRVLRPGDHVAVGRCLLIFGSQEEIAEYLGTDQVRTQQDTTPGVGVAPGATLNLQPHADDDLDLFNLFPAGPPELPSQLKLLQQAQLADLISYVHDRIGSILYAAASVAAGNDEMTLEGVVEGLAEASPDHKTGVAGEMAVPAATWQNLLALEMELAVYLRSIAEPGGFSDSND